MVYSASSQRRSTTKRRGSKRLTVEGRDRYGSLGDCDDSRRDSGDPRQEDPAFGPVRYGLLRDAGGSG
jgi:hypothetical protein